MDEAAIKIVTGYINDHLDKSDEIPKFEVYTVWKSKILQNWKYMLSSTLPDGMYYELTYDGDKKCWYLDAYKKFQNVTITGMAYNPETGCDEPVKPLAVEQNELAAKEGRCLACEYHELKESPTSTKEHVYCKKYSMFVAEMKLCPIQKAEDEALCRMSM